MRKSVKILIIFFVILAIAIGGYLGFHKIFSNKQQTSSEYGKWIKIDRNYKPGDGVESVVKQYAQEENIYPFLIRKIKDPSLFGQFKGFLASGLTEEDIKESDYYQDWVIVDLKYKDENGKEVYRRALFVQVADGKWGVIDSYDVK